jgi:hypothetical protein
VPAYTRADARLELKLSSQLSAAVVGRNLLDRAHLEFGGVGPIQATAVPRSMSIDLVWRPWP